LDIPKYLSTLGLSIESVTNRRSNAVRLRRRPAALGYLATWVTWCPRRYRKNVFAADEFGCGRFHPLWKSGSGRKPRTNERRLRHTHMWMLCGPQRPQYLGDDLILFDSNLVYLWSNLRDRSGPPSRLNLSDAKATAPHAKDS
jgi:hypothetical protein